MNEQIAMNLVSNAIVTTAMLANEMNIQTKGEFLIPEEDYLHYVKAFQFKLSKRLVPIQSKEDLKLEAKAYIAEILKSSGEDVNVCTDDSGSIQGSEIPNTSSEIES